MVQDIKGKKELVRISSKIKREIEQRLDCLDGYKVKKSMGGTTASVYVYGDKDGYMTSTVIRIVQAIVGYYMELYGFSINYGVDFLKEKGCGCIRINIMSVE